MLPDANKDLYMERLPYLSELIRRIDDVNQAIKSGQTGIDEVENLISDLPKDWLFAIKSNIDSHRKAYEKEKHDFMAQLSKGKSSTFKTQISQDIIRSGKVYSRLVKQEVIDYLNEKHLLILTRQPVSESEFVDVYHDNEKL